MARLANWPENLPRDGLRVVEMFCDIDGNPSEPSPRSVKPENLEDLIKVVRETDVELGLAFDGDGDRLGVVTKHGDIIFPDRQMMLFAGDVLSRNPGATIIYDVKCTRLLDKYIRGPRRRADDVEDRALAGQGKTGNRRPAGRRDEQPHLFKERWYGFDDAIYCGARLLEIVSKSANPEQGAGRTAERTVHARAQPEMRRG